MASSQVVHCLVWREDIVQLNRKETLTNRELELREGILTGGSLIGGCENVV